VQIELHKMKAQLEIRWLDVREYSLLPATITQATFSASADMMRMYECACQKYIHVLPSNFNSVKHQENVIMRIFRLKKHSKIYSYKCYIDLKFHIIITLYIIYFYHMFLS